MKNFKFLSLLFLCCLVSTVEAGEYDEDIARYRQIIEKDPTDLDTAYQLGNKLAWDAQYEEALQVYEQILIKEPDYLEAKIGVARVYSWMGEQEKATQKYQEILETNTRSFEVYQGLGSLSLWVNDFEKSIGYFKKALALNSEDIISVKGIGRAYLGRGDRRKAEEYFTQAQILEIKKTSLPLILGFAGGGIFVFLVIFIFIRSRISRRKKEFLKMEIRALKYAIALHHQKKGTYPLALEMLCQERWLPPGEKEEKEFLSGIRQGDRGFLVDPFGHRYWYNPDTGGIYSTTKGCEEC